MSDSERITLFFADILGESAAGAGSSDFVIRTEGDSIFYVDVEGSNVWRLTVTDALTPEEKQ